MSVCVYLATDITSVSCSFCLDAVSSDFSFFTAFSCASLELLTSSFSWVISSSRDFTYNTRANTGNGLRGQLFIFTAHTCEGRQLVRWPGGLGCTLGDQGADCEADGNPGREEKQWRRGRGRGESFPSARRSVPGFPRRPGVMRRNG